MRKWHRWIAVFFGIFLVWIAATGILNHLIEWIPGLRGGPPPGPPHSNVDPNFVCPSDMICFSRRPPEGAGNLVRLIHGLHSGEAFGPAGPIVSFLSGIALLFFAFSGLWMYIQMWRNRSARGAKPRWFWK